MPKKSKKSVKIKPIKAWALVENDRLCHYYTLVFITFTKRQAQTEQKYYNEPPLNHKMKIIPALITPLTNLKKKDK